MLSDPIADMLTRIRNAYMANKKVLRVSCSKLNEDILNILKKLNYITNFKKVEKVLKGKTTKFEDFEVILTYNNDKPAIETIKRISKPGRRVYVKAKQIKPVLSGYGVSIISTAKGLMTNKEAREKNLGGEVFCEIS